MSDKPVCAFRSPSRLAPRLGKNDAGLCQDH
jgi:hypothetical protein